MKPVVFAFLTLTLAGCLDTGQDVVTIPLQVSGTSVTEPVSASNGWSVELREARVAFGPLYLCPGYQAGALCETARMEWTGSAVVDALDPMLHEVGALSGVTGSVRSWMYDLGITSLLTQRKPLILPAAEQLEGNSIVLAGIARKGPHAIPFRFEIPIQQDEEAEIGASVVRKSGSDRFEHEITGTESALSVQFDARAWAKDVDFEALVETAACEPGGAAVVCDGAKELTCDDTGSPTAEMDCGTAGMACLRGIGCTSEARFAANSQGYRAVRTALVAQERPEFKWDTAP